jgi:methyl-accepting chemotaxis protein
MKNLSMIKKLQIGIATMVILSVLSSVINYASYLKIDKANGEFEKLNKTNTVLNAFVSLLTNNTLGYMDAIVDKDSGDVDAGIMAKHDEFRQWVEKNKNDFSEHIVYLKPDADLTTFFSKIDTYSTAGGDMLVEIKNKKIDELGKYDDKIDGINEELQVEITTYLKLSEVNFLAASENVKSAENLIAQSSLVSAIAITICGILIAFYINKSINFTFETTGKELAEGTDIVLKSSVEFADLGILIKDSTNKQASSLQESVSAVDEIKATIDRNAELAQESVNVAERCSNSTRRGKEAIKEMLSAVETIEDGHKSTNGILDNTTREIKEMVTVIKEISQKTEVINDIVFQTKLLSFNASVEAARAGEHGKGFAVVAEEVGNLAAMSGNAAKEINELLSSSIQKVESIVEKTERSSTEINKSNSKGITAGLQTAKNCDEALLEIDENVSKMKDMIREINSGSSEQSQGIGSISIALNELDHITNENVLSAEKCASNASDLNTQSKNLENAVNNLFVAIKG